ncbi:hypothetical protein AAFF_G00162040 [Aldrovandia affinis]|uniref:Uncharacterized protein n=1 Tax=Aldrovandia affinis TaxID=143900 RepID=A0AAD7W7T5_9TELE|nr:hypothetical protein AAFF_G00162040 [Aldrovandia affinis]
MLESTNQLSVKVTPAIKLNFYAEVTKRCGPLLPHHGRLDVMSLDAHRLPRPPRGPPRAGGRGERKQTQQALARPPSHHFSVPYYTMSRHSLGAGQLLNYCQEPVGHLLPRRPGCLV